METIAVVVIEAIVMVMVMVVIIAVAAAVLVVVVMETAAAVVGDGLTFACSDDSGCGCVGSSGDDDGDVMTLL
jgi:hypothetical protein